MRCTPRSANRQCTRSENANLRPTLLPVPIYMDIAVVTAAVVVMVLTIVVVVVVAERVEVIIMHRWYLAEVALGLWAWVKESLRRKLTGLMGPLQDGTLVESKDVSGVVVEAHGCGGSEDGGEGEGARV